MKKLLPVVFFVGFFSVNWLKAQPSPELSGIYQELTLGVDPSQGVVTGYYKEVYEPPNMPHLECSFYLFGKKQGSNYAIQAWSPVDKKLKVADGELAFFSADHNKASVLLRIGSLDRDCTAIKPNLAKGQGAFFDMKKPGAWTEVRMVANSKSPYYQAPDLSSPTRDSAKRGTVLTVSERRPDWAQVQSDQKPKGWIREAELYPLSPSMALAKPAPPVAEPPPVAAKKNDAGALPASKPEPTVETKDMLIARLKVLNAEAFEMALQVLKVPAKRNALAAKRIEMERNFDTLVSQLNSVAPSAYAEESREIFEAFLDLQYVEQERPVVSLRLNKIIQGLGK